MKAKILTIIISFIFLFTFFSNTLYAVTNEIVTNDENVINTEESEENSQKTDEVSDSIDKIEEIADIKDGEKNSEDNLEDNNIEISNLKNESVEEKSKNENNNFVESEITNSYYGNVLIESPTHNQILTRPDEDIIEVSGWALSNDRNDKLKILVDEIEMESEIIRIERKDILVSHYGKIDNNLNPGFCGKINISNFEEGKHILKVVQMSENDEFINSFEIPIEIKNKKFDGKLFIESPNYNQILTRPDEEIFEIRGWAVSNDKNAKIKISVDNIEMENNIIRKERKDVDEVISHKYGGTENTPEAGFCGKINLSNFEARKTYYKSRGIFKIWRFD